MMKPVHTMSEEAARRVRIVFTDIDDTLTTQGKLTAAAYAALWRLRDAGIAVVPVTGRPAGWCDLVARQWPVEGVVGENGALAFWEVEGRLERLYHPEVADKDVRAQLRAVEEAVLAEVQGSRVSKDQFARMFDLAIDFCEEPPDLGLDGARAILSVFERFGARAKISSIHVNGWFGNYDKLSMVQLFAERRWGVDVGQSRHESMFCGDSPNDEPMFEFFPNTCGVGNLRGFADGMQHLPTYIATGIGGEGFAEIVDVLLSLRSGVEVP